MYNLTIKIIRQIYLIKDPVDQVWAALTDPKIIDEWGGGLAKMDEKVGTKFTLWGGNIHGTNTKVVKNKELYQDWFGGDWEKPSKLEFHLTQEKNETKLELIHKNVPDKEIKSIEEGWKEYYLGPLKNLLSSSRK